MTYLLSEEGFPTHFFSAHTIHCWIYMAVASSAKDRGNNYLREKNFNEAIDCYSKSIRHSLTAVAYAKRAAAHLKINEYLQAENDCTEALNLDRQYTKAYAHRAMARKELGVGKNSLLFSERML